MLWIWVTVIRYRMASNVRSLSVALRSGCPTSIRARGLKESNLKVETTRFKRGIGDVDERAAYGVKARGQGAYGGGCARPDPPVMTPRARVRTM